MPKKSKKKLTEEQKIEKRKKYKQKYYETVTKKTKEKEKTQEIIHNNTIKLQDIKNYDLQTALVKKLKLYFAECTKNEIDPTVLYTDNIINLSIQCGLCDSKFHIKNLDNINNINNLHNSIKNKKTSQTIQIFYEQINDTIAPLLIKNHCYKAVEITPLLYRINNYFFSSIKRMVNKTLIDALNDTALLSSHNIKFTKLLQLPNTPEVIRNLFNQSYNAHDIQTILTNPIVLTEGDVNIYNTLLSDECKKHNITKQELYFTKNTNNTNNKNTTITQITQSVNLKFMNYLQQTYFNTPNDPDTLLSPNEYEKLLPYYLNLSLITITDCISYTRPQQSQNTQTQANIIITATKKQQVQLRQHLNLLFIKQIIKNFRKYEPTIISEFLKMNTIFSINLTTLKELSELHYQKQINKISEIAEVYFTILICIFLSPPPDDNPTISNTQLLQEMYNNYFLTSDKYEYSAHYISSTTIINEINKFYFLLTPVFFPVIPKREKIYKHLLIHHRKLENAQLDIYENMKKIYKKL